MNQLKTQLVAMVKHAALVLRPSIGQIGSPEFPTGTQNGPPITNHPLNSSTPGAFKPPATPQPLNSGPAPNTTNGQNQPAAISHMHQRLPHLGQKCHHSKCSAHLTIPLKEETQDKDIHLLLHLLHGLTSMLSQ